MLYRIVHNRYLATAWTGYGAETYGGRWNHKGHAAIYLASSVSLAMLETLVHVEDSATLNDFNLFQITIPDNAIMVLQQQDWPRGWRDDPHPRGHHGHRHRMDWFSIICRSAGTIHVSPFGKKYAGES